MPIRFRQRSNVEQLQAHHGNTGWTILWETRQPPDGARWSIANEGTETAALDRARHLLRLGFIVHAIKDPSGAVFMDQPEIKRRLAKAPRNDAAAATAD